MHKTWQILRSVVCCTAVLLVAAAAVRAADGPEASPEIERELLVILRSEAPKADKAIACKKLAIHGSSDAVPDLARLLPDVQLASWARIALEAIPGSAADEALRKSLDSLQGLLLVGSINSIGVRRDAGAVDALTTRLAEKDTEVAAAAAVALGRIGNAAAARSLRQSLATGPVKVRSAVAEGCVLCAERFLSEGKAAEAVELYDEVRKAEVPKQRILEATRGAILARNEEGIPLLLEQFKSPDKAMFQLALSTAREFPGGNVDKALAAEMASAPSERAALIVQAMADRKETVVLAAVLKAAGEGPRQVRISAIDALGRVGNVSCLSALLAIAMEADEELTQTAKTTLADLPGDDVNAQIVALLPESKGRMYPLLIELVGRRRIEALSDLLKALDHSDAAVRSAALTALGETVPLKELSVLIKQAVAPKHAADAAVAQQALKAASIRMPDREECAAELAAAVDRSSSVSTKSTLLEILGAVGGAKALATVGAAARSSDPELQDVSSRLLGEWMTADAAPVLLDLSKTAPGEKYQVRAMRGYIRISRQFVMPIQERVDMCQKALDGTRRVAEQKLVLDVLKQYPSVETLKLAIKARQIPELKADATEATQAIAQKLRGKGVNVKELLSKAGLE